MKGSIRKRGEAWQLRVYVGRDSVTGREIYLSETFRGSRRNAETALAKLVAKATETTGSNATVSTLLDRWVEAVAHDWSASTRREHESIIRNHVRPMLGHIKLAKLTSADLDSWYALLRKKRGRNGAGLAPATIKRISVVMSSALSQAVKWEWIPSNPSLASTPPRIRTRELTVPSATDVARLLELVATSDRDYYTYLRLAASTGARRSQILGLKWSDINFSTARLMFARAVVFDEENQLHVKGTKTDRTYRVSLDTGTIAVLRSHHETCSDRAATARTKLLDDAFVFSMEVDGSKPWRPDLATGRFRRWSRKAGLPNVRLHDLRHFMATEMLTAGVPVPVVAGRLGHSRASTTLNVYSHFIEGGDAEAAENLGDLLQGSMDIPWTEADENDENRKGPTG